MPADSIASASPILDDDGQSVVLAPQGVSMGDIVQLGNRLDKVLTRWREKVTEPTGSKQPPTFSATQIAELCGRSTVQMKRLLDKAAEKNLPDGALPAGVRGRSRVFSLADARQWVHTAGKRARRPEGARGATICVANFKGGVGKTVVSMTLAQGLSLRTGARVLAIDFDPQGSLTSVLGVSPAAVDEQDTVVPLMYPKSHEGSSDTLQSAIRSTYWDGIDLIPANHALFSGEFYLPTRQMRAGIDEPDFQFWEVLNKALDAGIREEYDYIIIDTPPALSYMTMTTFWAADAILLPLPPEGIDFASSAQFWTMLSDLASGTTDRAAQGKTYGWVGVVPSKVDNNKLHTKELLSLMKAGYRDMLLSTEIPETAAVRVGGARMESVYDIQNYAGDRRTLLRAREAYDRLVDEVDFLTHRNIWNTTA